ncbi:raftlin [Neosynchiropus ocellatus]
MGCRLPKLRKAEEKRSPGNIYSTLRRPQVETKVGVAYTYHFLDFMLGKEEVPVSSVLCLSSVRELPVQVRELYAQGFVLVAVHPFVHPCGPRQAHIQRQLHRAVLVRETPSLEKSHLTWTRHRLETDVCVAGHQAADPDAIQSYVKRIQDVAEQGVMFLGFLQQPGGAPFFSGNWDPEELSSLHSSPSPIHRHPHSANSSLSDPTDPPHNDEEPFDPQESDHESLDQNHRPVHPQTRHAELDPENPNGHLQNSEISIRVVLGSTHRPHREPACSSPESAENHLQNHRQKRCSTSCPNRVTAQNNNHIQANENSGPAPSQARMQLFALYNSTGQLHASERFYSLTVPLRFHKEAGLVTEVDADWLDHMTQHFMNGAQLVDGFFHLRDDNDNGHSSVDSVFIFRSSEDQRASTSYDAIVVEQWTVVDGVVVKADYVPLLQSLAPFGWRLMCVLPTPIVKTNSDGSLSTKQILFLQRPVLQRRRKDFKMLNLKGRTKARKSLTGETPEERNQSLVMEMDRWRPNSTEGNWIESWSSGRTEEGGEEAERDAQPEKSLLFLPGSRAVEGQAVDADLDGILTFRQDLSVRWTDVCHRDAEGNDAEVKRKERIRQQLFSGVC